MRGFDYSILKHTHRPRALAGERGAASSENSLRLHARRVRRNRGIYFFSLDAASAFAVHAARTMLNLPYFTADMSVTKENGVVRYASRRDGHRPDAGRLDIHHLPWPLRPARAEFAVNTMAAVHGIALPDEPPILHYVDRQDMVAWMPLSLVRRTDFALQPSMESER
jgi:hypothetical protein